jgi:ribokinase
VKRSGQVVVVGTLNVDHVWQVPQLPRPGQTVLASAVERQFGGKGANQAVAAARQGANVTLFGRVGDDADGRAYREHLVRQGVRAHHVKLAAGVATGTAHVYVEPRGENLIVVDRGANAQLDLTALGTVLRTQDILLTQLECGLDAVLDALRVAAACGARSLLNASPVSADFPWGRFAIEVAIVNEHECRSCFDLEPEALWALPEKQRVARLKSKNVRHVVITRGAASTLHVSARGRREVPTFPVQPRDTVGAGDTFAGVLATELARGHAWERALKHANVAAALSTLALGAQAAMPTRAEVEAAVAKAG